MKQLTILLKKEYSKPDRFEVAEDVQIEIFGRQFTIPAGYKTDFASVPQALWGIFPPHGLAAIPALIHDFMYDNKVFADDLGDENARRLADVFFLNNMSHCGVPRWQRMIYFYGVRWFAKSWWSN
jgi:hypothetical protein